LSQIYCFSDIIKRFISIVHSHGLSFSNVSIICSKELQTEGAMEHLCSMGPINSHFWKSV